MNALCSVTLAIAVSMLISSIPVQVHEISFSYPIQIIITPFRHPRSERYMMTVEIKNLSDQSADFDLVVSHGAADWDINSFRYSYSSGETNGLLCEDDEKVNLCQVNWRGTLGGHQQTQFFLTAEVPENDSKVYLFTSAISPDALLVSYHIFSTEGLLRKILV